MEQVKKKIQIVLKIDNEKKTFVAPYLTGEVYKDLFDMAERIQGPKTKESINVLIDFVCRVFGNKFTIDEYYKGVSLSKFLSEIVRIVNELTELVMNGVEQDTQQ